MKTAFSIPFIIAICTAAYAQEVTISSEPAGAMVMINGQYIGLAPVKKDLKDGDYRLHLKRKGYQEFNLDVTVPLKDPKVQADLKPIKKGSLHITSDPAECSVNINGQPAGTTPITVKDLADDVYQVRVQKPNYSTYMKSVEITDGEDVEIRAELTSLMEEYYLREIEQNPNDLMKYSELGHYYLLKNKWNQAAAIFKKGVEAASDLKRHDAGLMRFYQELSKAYNFQFNFCDRSEISKFRESFADVIEYSIEKGPSHVRWYKQIVSMYIRNADETRVMDLVRRMHKAEPNRNVYKEFGDIFLQGGITDRAIKMYQKALEVKDEYLTRYSLATAYHRKGDFEHALQEYETCKAMDTPASAKTELYHKLARLYYEKNKPEEALRYIDQSLQQSVDDERNLLKVNILIKLKKLDEARALAEKIAGQTASNRTKKAAKYLLDGVLKAPEDVKTEQK